MVATLPDKVYGKYRSARGARHSLPVVTRRVASSAGAALHCVLPFLPNPIMHILLHRVRRCAPMLFSGLLLGACATLSEDQCRGGDWQAIGFRDGQNGRSADYLAQHRTACAKYALGTDEPAYLLGRERGLQHYCTAAIGLAAGRRGERYAGVCPLEKEADFLRGFELGQSVYQARQRVDELQRQRRELDQRIDKASKADRPRLMIEMSRLRFEYDLAWDDLRRREDRAARLRF